jgi:hypothetical protein
MKTILAVTCIFACIVCRQAHAGDQRHKSLLVETNGLHLSIKAKGGDKLINSNRVPILLIQYKNNATNNTYGFRYSTPFERSAAYNFRVLAPSGKEIRMMTPNSEPNAHLGDLKLIQPQETVIIEFDPSKRFVLEESGVYTIQLQQSMMIFGGETNRTPSVVATSNPLKFALELKASGNDTNSTHGGGQPDKD